MSAGRPARASGLAYHGLVQVAEGLLDAGVDVVRTPGAVRAWSCWFGRWLGQPCPGLVGDRAGLVALGARKAIVEVWRRGVGHGDCPGSRSGRAVRPAPRSGGVRGARLEQLYLLPRAGSSRPAGDVTARRISPGIYGERCTAVAAGPVGERGRRRLTAHQSCLKRWEDHPKCCRGGPALPAAAIREQWRRPGGPEGVSESASAPPGAARIFIGGCLRWVLPLRIIRFRDG